MAVSRGSIRHSLAEDLRSLAATTIRPTRCAARATADEKAHVAAALSQRLNVARVAMFPYARTGFHAILQALDLPCGSEILLTPITIGPMLEIIVALGLRPVFVDIELETFGPDPEDLARHLQRRPAAFLLTYLFGYVPNVHEIVKACTDAGTPVIEDFSHNIGATFRGREVGTFGRAGVYSASLLKYVDGYNGGFVVTNDADFGKTIAAKAETLTAPDPGRIQGIVRRTVFWNTALNRHIFNLATFPALRCLKAVSRASFERLLGPSISLNLQAKELPAYYFEDITGFQCRTILRHLAELDDLLQARRRNAGMAAEAWLDATDGNSAGCTAAIRMPDAAHTYWQFVARVKNVADARDVLFRHGVETGTTNLMNLAAAAGIELPHARELKERCIFIPLHSHLRRTDYLSMFRSLRSHGQI